VFKATPGPLEELPPRDDLIKKIGSRTERNQNHFDVYSSYGITPSQEIRIEWVQFPFIVS
jgi:hypothetical protein